MMPHLVHPAGALLLLGALPIIALYLLRHRKPPLKISSLLLFRPTDRDRQAQKSWRRLLPELSLLLQLAMTVLLALAAMQPSWANRSETEGALAIVLDVSASMAARDSGATSRLDRAKAEARALLQTHGAGTAFLVLAGTAPRLAAGHDAGDLATELEITDAEDSGADLERAVLLAEEKVRGLAGARIVVLTDVNSTFETARPLVRTRRFGAPRANVAVLSARAERQTSGVEVAAVIVAHDDHERDVRVVLRALATATGERIEAPPLDVRVLHVLPKARTPVRFLVPAQSADAAYEIALADATDEALDRDDRAVAIVPVSAKLPVVVVGPAFAPLARALAADERLALQMVSSEEHARIDVPSDALEIFLDQCPAVRRGRDAVVFGPPPGRCLDVDVAEPSPTLRTLDGFRSDDPRVRFLSFDDVHAERATTLRARGGEGVLAEDRRGALIVDASTPARMTTLVGFSLTTSDLASRRSFVVFLRNLTELATRHRTRAGRADLRAGESASLAVPEDVMALTLDGEPLVAHGGDTIVPPRPRAGLSILRWTEPRVGAQLVPVAFGAAAESDLLTVPVAADSTADARPSSPGTAGGAWRWIDRNLETMIALCILLVLALELLVFTRRPSWTARTPVGRRP